MNDTKEKKYAFILTFKCIYGWFWDATYQCVLYSDEEELCYSQINDAQNMIQRKIKRKIKTAILLNCTRMLNEKSE